MNLIKAFQDNKVRKICVGLRVEMVNRGGDKDIEFACSDSVATI